MNENNEQSIYLIPAANSDAVGVTSIGQLRLLISHLEPEADGSKAVLQIKPPTAQFCQVSPALWSGAR